MGAVEQDADSDDGVRLADWRTVSALARQPTGIEFLRASWRQRDHRRQPAIPSDAVLGGQLTLAR